ncbi:MAG: Holliday junction DNA helicase RuvA [Epulopiscium sp. Nele67-Bin004]|nr:MAG: Holliday junction DNA helicase RuvA [Epulopiscium sp. Nele67-Bin004]
MRILGLDFGSNTTGIAVSDPSGLIAQGLEIVKRSDEFNIKPTLNRINEICEQYKVEKIVLGLPKNMNNTHSQSTEATLVFKTKLENKIKLPVELWDERLSTVSAENMLISADVSRAKRKKVIDKVAAVFILQNYLDAKGRF